MAEESITALEKDSPTGALLRIAKTSIFSAQDQEILTISRKQALAIAQVFDKIEDFATGSDV